MREAPHTRTDHLEGQHDKLHENVFVTTVRHLIPGGADGVGGWDARLNSDVAHGGSEACLHSHFAHRQWEVCLHSHIAGEVEVEGVVG